jgi:hypothetical protein
MNDGVVAYIKMGVLFTATKMVSAYITIRGKSTQIEKTLGTTLAKNKQATAVTPITT